MDNPETLASLDTQDTEWRQRTNKKTQKTKKMSNTESRPKTGGVLRCTCAAIHSDYVYLCSEARVVMSVTISA
jgi:hypothetical protein